MVKLIPWEDIAIEEAELCKIIDPYLKNKRLLFKSCIHSNVPI